MRKKLCQEKWLEEIGEKVVSGSGSNFDQMVVVNVAVVYFCSWQSCETYRDAPARLLNYKQPLFVSVFGIFIVYY